MAEFNLDGWELREIKSAPVTESELAEMYKLTNSYGHCSARNLLRLKPEK